MASRLRRATNGVDDVRRLTASEIRAREPELSPRALEALLVPGEHVIDPWSPFLAYLLQAKAHGAEISFATEVVSGAFDGETWTLQTTTGERRARTVVNCAGLYGDRLDARLLGAASFQIRPRKGQFVVFDKAAAKLLGTIILPVPSERTKGVVLYPHRFRKRARRTDGRGAGRSRARDRRRKRATRV